MLAEEEDGVAHAQVASLALGPWTIGPVSHHDQPGRHALTHPGERGDDVVDRKFDTCMTIFSPPGASVERWQGSNPGRHACTSMKLGITSMRSPGTEKSLTVSSFR